MICRRLGVVFATISVVTGTALMSVPASGATGISYDFGAHAVGTTTEALLHVPLSTTIGAVRSDVAAALSVASFPSIDVPGVGTVVSTAQFRQVALDALASLPDATVLAIRVDGVSATGADFGLVAADSSCVGADGVSTSACDEAVSFTPLGAGLRVGGVEAALTVTAGDTELMAAVQDALASDLGVIGSIASLALPLMRPALLDEVGGALNPVVALQGAGVVPPPTVSVVSHASVVEGNAGTTVVSLPVTLSYATDVAVALDWSTVDGTARIGNHDYVATTGTLVIPAGAIQGTINVRVVGDTHLEDDETFTVQIGNVTGATAAGTVASVSILNDELPAVRLTGSSVPEGAAAPFSVRLVQHYAYPLTLTWHTIDGTAATAAGDYVPVVGATIVVPPGTYGPVRGAVVTSVDGVPELAEQLKVSVAGGANTPVVALTIRSNVT